VKKKLLLFGLVALATTVLASLVVPPYDDKKAPALSLPDAYQFAVLAIGSSTNEFHCVAAGITTDFGDPRWSFTFYSTNSLKRQRWIVVDFSGKTVEDNGAR
jgi:hypothetical protein